MIALNEINMSELEKIKHKLEVAEKLLEERQKLIDAIPECPIHGKCIPHALEWIEKQKLLCYSV